MKRIRKDPNGAVNLVFKGINASLESRIRTSDTQTPTQFLSQLLLYSFSFVLLNHNTFKMVSEYSLVFNQSPCWHVYNNYLNFLFLNFRILCITIATKF